MGHYDVWSFVHAQFLTAFFYERFPAMGLVPKEHEPFFTDEVFDAEGHPVLDAEGQPVTRQVRQSCPLISRWSSLGTN